MKVHGSNAGRRLEGAAAIAGALGRSTAWLFHQLSDERNPVFRAVIREPAGRSCRLFAFAGDLRDAMDELNGQSRTPKRVAKRKQGGGR